MNDSRKLAPRRPYGRAVKIGSLLVAILAQGAAAQTLTSPTSPSPKAPSTIQTQPPSPKTVPNAAKSCSIFGEGFVPVPGTDTCVKAGGYLRTETVISR